MRKNKKKKFEETGLPEEENVVSATECTGLMPALPDSMAEEKAIKDIYDIP